jgi:hypothetical protein
MLLRRNYSRGFPVEYLLARIRVRRTALVDDWQPLLIAANPLDALPHTGLRARPSDWTAEGIWKSLLLEFDWVFRCMDDPTRNSFVPFFTWFELRTLIQCLRIREGKKTADVGELLAGSLLAEKLKRILASEQDLTAMVAAVETVCAAQSPAFCGLLETYRRSGLQGFEQELTDTWLEGTIRGELHPVMLCFVRCLIDYRNLLHLYKLLRWKMTATPVFLRGGAIGRGRLDDVYAGREPEGIAALLQSFPGMGEKFDAGGNPENLLLGAITRFFGRRSREPSGYGLILDYLWGAFIETVNLGILCQGVNIDRDAVASELIQ